MRAANVATAQDIVSCVCPLTWICRLRGADTKNFARTIMAQIMIHEVPFLSFGQLVEMLRGGCVAVTLDVFVTGMCSTGSETGTGRRT